MEDQTTPKIPTKLITRSKTKTSKSHQKIVAMLNNLSKDKTGAPVKWKFNKTGIKQANRVGKRLKSATEKELNTAKSSDQVKTNSDTSIPKRKPGRPKLVKTDTADSKDNIHSNVGKQGEDFCENPDSFEQKPTQVKKKKILSKDIRLKRLEILKRHIERGKARGRGRITRVRELHSPIPPDEDMDLQINQDKLKLLKEQINNERRRGRGRGHYRGRVKNVGNRQFNVTQNTLLSNENSDSQINYPVHIPQRGRKPKAKRGRRPWKNVRDGSEPRETSETPSEPRRGAGRGRSRGLGWTSLNRQSLNKAALNDDTRQSLMSGQLSCSDNVNIDSENESIDSNFSTTSSKTKKRKIFNHGIKLGPSKLTRSQDSMKTRESSGPSLLKKRKRTLSGEFDLLDEASLRKQMREKDDDESTVKSFDDSWMDINDSSRLSMEESENENVDSVEPKSRPSKVGRPKKHLSNVISGQRAKRLNPTGRLTIIGPGGIQFIKMKKDGTSMDKNHIETPNEESADMEEIISVHIEHDESIKENLSFKTETKTFNELKIDTTEEKTTSVQPKDTFDDGIIISQETIMKSLQQVKYEGTPKSSPVHSPKLPEETAKDPKVTDTMEMTEAVSFEPNQEENNEMKSVCDNLKDNENIACQDEVPAQDNSEGFTVDKNENTESVHIESDTMEVSKTEKNNENEIEENVNLDCKIDENEERNDCGEKLPNDQNTDVSDKLINIENELDDDKSSNMDDISENNEIKMDSESVKEINDPITIRQEDVKDTKYNEISDAPVTNFDEELDKNVTEPLSCEQSESVSKTVVKEVLGDILNQICSEPSENNCLHEKDANFDDLNIDEKKKVLKDQVVHNQDRSCSPVTHNENNLPGRDANETVQAVVNVTGELKAKTNENSQDSSEHVEKTTEQVLKEISDIVDEKSGDSLKVNEDNLQDFKHTHLVNDETSPKIPGDGLLKKKKRKETDTLKPEVDTEDIADPDFTSPEAGKTEVKRVFQLRKKASRSPLEIIAMKHSMEERQYMLEETQRAMRREEKQKKIFQNKLLREKIEQLSPPKQSTELLLRHREMLQDSPEKCDISQEVHPLCRPCSVVLIDFVKYLKMNDSSDKTSSHVMDIDENYTAEDKSATDSENVSKIENSFTASIAQPTDGSEPSPPKRPAKARKQAKSYNYSAKLTAEIVSSPEPQEGTSPSFTVPPLRLKIKQAEQIKSKKRVKGNKWTMKNKARKQMTTYRRILPKQQFEFETLGSKDGVFDNQSTGYQPAVSTIGTTQTSQSNTYRYKCTNESCEFRCQQKSIIECHVYTHLDIPFKCSHCDEHFHSKNLAFNHCKVSHASQEPKITPMEIIDESRYYEEITSAARTDNSNVIQADIADFQHSSESVIISLRLPKNITEASSSCYCCSHCEFSSHIVQEVNKHVEDKHKELIQYICNVCNKPVNRYGEGIARHFSNEHPDKPVAYKSLPDFYDIRKTIEKPTSSDKGNIFDRMSDLFTGKKDKGSKQVPEKTSAEADSTTAETEEELVPSTSEASSNETVKEPDGIEQLAQMYGTPTSTDDEKSSSLDKSGPQKDSQLGEDNDMGLKIVDVVSLQGSSDFVQNVWGETPVSKPTMSLPQMLQRPPAVRPQGQAPATSVPQPIQPKRQIMPVPQSMPQASKMDAAKMKETCQTYKCEKCNVHAPVLSSMVEHLRNGHKEIPRLFLCPFCRQYEGATEPDIHKHIKQFHPSPDTRSPPVALSSDAKQHLRTIEVPVGDTPKVNGKYLMDKDIYKCLKCKRHMPSLDYIYEHLEKDHNEVFVYVCPDCKQFRAKEEEVVYNHIKTVHNKNTDDIILSLAIEENLFTRVMCLTKDKQSQNKGTTQKQVPNPLTNLSNMTNLNRPTAPLPPQVPEITQRFPVYSFPQGQTFRPSMQPVFPGMLQNQPRHPLVPASVHGGVQMSVQGQSNVSVHGAIPMSFQGRANIPSTVPHTLQSGMPTSAHSNVRAPLQGSVQHSIHGGIPLSVQGQTAVSVPSSVPQSFHSGIPMSSQGQVSASVPRSLPMSLTSQPQPQMNARPQQPNPPMNKAAMRKSYRPVHIPQGGDHSVRSEEKKATPPPLMRGPPPLIRFQGNVTQNPPSSSSSIRQTNFSMTDKVQRLHPHAQGQPMSSNVSPPPQSRPVLKVPSVNFRRTTTSPSHAEGRVPEGGTPLDLSRNSTPNSQNDNSDDADDVPPDAFQIFNLQPQRPPTPRVTSPNFQGPPRHVGPYGPSAYHNRPPRMYNPMYRPPPPYSQPGYNQGPSVQRQSPNQMAAVVQRPLKCPYCASIVPLSMSEVAPHIHKYHPGQKVVYVKID